MSLSRLTGLPKFVQAKLRVLICIKNGFTVNAPNNHMLGLAGEVKASRRVTVEPQ